MKTYQLFLLICGTGVLVLLTSFLSLDSHIAKEALKWEQGVVSQSLHVGHEFFHMPREKKLDVPRIPGIPGIPGIVPAVAVQKGKGAGKPPPAVVPHHEPVVVPAAVHGKPGDKKKNKGRGPKHVKAKPGKQPDPSPPVADRGSKGGLNYGDGCLVNPLVKYWDENYDAYVSPLRQVPTTLSTLSILYTYTIYLYSIFTIYTTSYTYYSSIYYYLLLIPITYHQTHQVNGLSASPEERRFVVFQPDQGGWNNIRYVGM
jgi:hypothetical protein